jgi:hypothetical protein
MDELGKSIPAAEGMVDAEQAGKSQRHNEFCLNCGTKLTDIYCHHCGQKDIPRRQTLGELLTNFVSSFWSYEGKFFLTTKYLITRPGFLAVEYNAGRRESYYHPARMYVFISFVFFLLFFSLPDRADDDADSQAANKETKEDLDEAVRNAVGAGTAGKEVPVDSILNAVARTDSTLKKVLPPALLDSMTVKTEQKKKKKGFRFGLQKSEYKSIASYDSAQLAKPEKDRHNWLTRKFVMRGIELNDKYKGDISKFGKDFGAAFKENFSKLLFYLLPFFALLLKLLYVRRDYFYSEHLVFSIYYYNFFYLAGCILMLVNLIPGTDWPGTVIGFWIFFYLLFAMKRMYQQSWRKTTLKFILFSFSFFFFVLIGFLVSAMAIIMMI